MNRFKCSDCGKVSHQSEFLRAPHPFLERSVSGCPHCGEVWGVDMLRTCEYQGCERAGWKSHDNLPDHTWRCRRHHPNLTGESERLGIDAVELNRERDFDD